MVFNRSLIFFAQYDNERYEYNRELEKHFQGLVTVQSGQAAKTTPKFAFWKRKKKHEIVYNNS